MTPSLYTQVNEEEHIHDNSLHNSGVFENTSQYIERMIIIFNFVLFGIYRHEMLIILRKMMFCEGFESVSTSNILKDSRTE